MHNRESKDIVNNISQETYNKCPPQFFKDLDNSTGLEAENVTADIAANIQNPEIGLLV